MGPLLSPPAARRMTLVFGLVLLLLTVLAVVFRGSRSGIPESGNPESGNPDEGGMLPSKARILQDTEHESIDQTIEALPSILDQALASTASGVSSPESYEWARTVIPRLTRVRKILGQINQQQRPRYTAVFLKTIDECLRGYARSRK